MSLQPLTDPTPSASRGKAKKTLLLALSLSGAVSLFSLPGIGSSNILDTLFRKTALASTENASYNSQTLPVLSAATNIDPNPPTGGGGVTLVHGEALMPVENPGGSSDSEVKPQNSQISIYVVRPGDTLSDIAAMFNVSMNTIIGANDIKNGAIYPGQELIILPITGIEHTVLKGESLASLASKYHSNAHDIASYNNLGDTDALAVGTRIIIPGGEVPTPAPQKPIARHASPRSGSGRETTKSGGTRTFTPAPLRDAGGPEYNGYYDWPLAGGIITQSLHGYNAVDIGAPTGTDIYASAGGTVIIAKFNGGWNGGYGNYIVIQHDNGTQTLYAHASKIFVSPGDTVRQDELIGKVGMTGEATGPHLHFEVRGATNPFGAISVGSGE